MNHSLKKTIRSQQGFTLVELLVYLFIFTIITSASIGLVFSLDKLLVQYGLQKDLMTSGVAIMDSLLVEIREADHVIMTDSVIASTTAAVLVFEKGSDVLRLEKEGASINVYRNNIFDRKLNQDKVSVTDLIFFHYTDGESEFIRVSLNLGATLGDQTESWTIGGGALIRGSYETD